MRVGGNTSVPLMELQMIFYIVRIIAKFKNFSIDLKVKFTDTTVVWSAGTPLFHKLVSPTLKISDNIVALTLIKEIGVVVKVNGRIIY